MGRIARYGLRVLAFLAVVWVTFWLTGLVEADATTVQGDITWLGHTFKGISYADWAKTIIIPRLFIIGMAGYFLLWFPIRRQRECPRYDDKEGGRPQ